MSIITESNINNYKVVNGDGIPPKFFQLLYN